KPALLLHFPLRQPDPCNSVSFVFFEQLQAPRQFDSSHWFFPTDFLQGVLIDPAAHEFSLWNSGDPRELAFVGNCIPFLPVLDSFEFQQAQILTFFPMLVGLLAYVN